MRRDPSTWLRVSGQVILKSIRQPLRQLCPPMRMISRPVIPAQAGIQLFQQSCHSRAGGNPVVSAVLSFPRRRESSCFSRPVIPAQAGIQLFQPSCHSRAGGNPVVSTGSVCLMDPRLRADDATRNCWAKPAQAELVEASFRRKSTASIGRGCQSDRRWLTSGLRFFNRLLAADHAHPPGRPWARCRFRSSPIDHS